MLKIFLLGKTEMYVNDLPLVFPSGKCAELLLLLANQTTNNQDLEKILGETTKTILNDPHISALLPFIKQKLTTTTLLAQTDLQDYKNQIGNLRQLAKMHKPFAPDFVGTSAAFCIWLENIRSELRCLLLAELLQHSVKLESQKRLAEATANQNFVAKDLESLLYNTAIHTFRIHKLLAAHHWKSNRVTECTQHLRAALELQPELQKVLTNNQEHLEISVNLAAALTRNGELRESKKVLQTVIDSNSTSKGWALAHLSNTNRFMGNLDEANQSAKAAFEYAKTDNDGDLAVAALCMQGEVLLLQAKNQTNAPTEMCKRAANIFGKALGISEALDESASILPLTGLCETHTLWGNKQKALEQGERAYKRARAANDSVAATRSLLALFCATKISGFAEKALNEAVLCQHKPYEVLALQAVLCKQAVENPELNLRLKTLAQTISMPWVLDTKI